MGIEARYDYTPQVYRRIEFASSQCGSFGEASQALAQLGELELLPKRVWRAAKRIGEERVSERRAAAERYAQLPLPAQRLSPVAQIPPVACVQMDGGRYQERERTASTIVQPSASGSSEQHDDGSWREFKAACLLSMSSQTHLEDPCPQLPATFVDPGNMREMAREIKGFTTESVVATPATQVAVDETKKKNREGKPEVLVKTVVATSGDIEAFAPLVACAAYQRGFHAAQRKAFVADGSATNWSVWRKYFSHYTPIVDFVHALMYVYAAAMAGRSPNEGWSLYRDWAQWLWGGDVNKIIAALEQLIQPLGPPEKDEKATPRAQMATSLGYLTNQRERMLYAQYRRQGLPITSSHIESTIKQINRRIKGTEKFWSKGVDAMLQLVADRLSQTNYLDKFWARRTQQIIDSACYHQAG